MTHVSLIIEHNGTQAGPEEEEVDNGQTQAWAEVNVPTAVVIPNQTQKEYCNKHNKRIKSWHVERLRTVQ